MKSQKNKLIISILFFLFSISKAQAQITFKDGQPENLPRTASNPTPAPSNLNSSYGNFKEGQSLPLLSDRIDIKKSPSSKSQIITTLPIGTLLNILKKEDGVIESINGYDAPWYLVGFEQDRIKKTGYIWGGFIGENMEVIGNAKSLPVQFTYGVESVSNKVPNLQIHAYRDYKELAKITVQALGSIDTRHSLTVYDSKGISGIKNILKINFKEKTDTGKNGNIYIFWTDTQLKLAYILQDGEFIMPSDQGGKGGRILLKTVIKNENSEEKNAEPIVKIDEFIWNGESLIKTENKSVPVLN